MNNKFEIKVNFSIDESGSITGIAWPFGSPDRVGDVIEKGAFATTSKTLPMLFSHDHTDPVGVWDTIEEKEDGLHVSGKMLVDEVSRSREVSALVRSGAIGGLSIGFSTKKATGREGGGRIITSLELVEISLVAVPCHPGARVTSAKTAVDALRISEVINRAAMALSQH